MTVTWQQRYNGFCETPDIFEEGRSPFSQFLSMFPVEALSTIPMSHRIGHVAEEFLERCLKSHDDYSIVSQNLQLIDNGITKGELDFIIRSARELIHLELVYKFYLYDPAVSDALSCWVGPNRKDLLSLKVEKLQNHQLPIGLDPLWSQKLDEVGVVQSDLIQKVLFKGHLFLPEGEEMPNGMNLDAYAGSWMSWEKFKSIQDDVIIPERKDWFIWNVPDELDWMSNLEGKQVVESYISEKRSPMVWLKDKQGSTRRVFVVWW